MIYKGRNHTYLLCQTASYTLAECLTAGKAYKKYLFYEWRTNKLISTKKCIFNVPKELTIHLCLCARNISALTAQTFLSVLFTDTSLISRTMLAHSNSNKYK